MSESFISAMTWLLVGIVFVRAWWAIIVSRKTQSWPATDGIVVWATRNEVTRTFRYTGTQAVYGYEVDGKRYIGNRIYYCISEMGMLQSMLFNTEKFLSKYYLDGQPVRVHYDPDNPKNSCLRVGGAFYGIIEAAVFSGVFLITLAIAWLLAQIPPFY